MTVVKWSDSISGRSLPSPTVVTSRLALLILVASFISDHKIARLVSSLTMFNIITL